MKLYKYCSPEFLELMFDRSGFCGIKCSFPRDYNDPYELFLSVDLKGSTELLATYREIVQDIPQYPTTCFSKQPTVSPMWAHYANNHTGFVLEFDADLIKRHFKDLQIKDVIYREDPDPALEDYLRRAAFTKKPRHAVWLQNAIIHQAYYSKFSSWKYEEESRLVASEKDIKRISDAMVLFVPTDCLSAIIVGSNSSTELTDRSKEIAEKCGASWLHSQIGKSMSSPFFKYADGSVWSFRDGQIAKAENVCGKCSEPINIKEELCPWCRITDKHLLEAARGNPLRIMDHFGILDEYLQGVEEIEREPRN